MLLPFTAESTHTITLTRGKVLGKIRLALGLTPAAKVTSPSKKIPQRNRPTKRRQRVDSKDDETFVNSDSPPPEPPSDSDVELIHPQPRVTYGPPLPTVASSPLESLPEALDDAWNSALEATSAVPKTAPNQITWRPSFKRHPTLPQCQLSLLLGHDPTYSPVSSSPGSHRLA